MKIGLIGRCDDRGIGIQTGEFYRHMPVERTLAVLMRDPAFPEDPNRFGRGALLVDSNLSTRRDQRGLDETRVRQFLDGLDVVFAVETVYDWRFISWAHEMGVKVVVQGNPEFYCHHVYGFDQPDRWVWPTDWMHEELSEHLPDEQLDVVEVPTVDASGFAWRTPAGDDGPLKVLHVVGKPAAGDRAGTIEFLEALPAIRNTAHITITSQENALPRLPRVRPNVHVETRLASVDNRWELYSDQHVLISPRKYGGLHLPALEAMAMGLAVVMPDVSPNETWPGPRLKGRMGVRVRSPFGPISTTAVHPMDIAQTIDRMAANRVFVTDAQAEAARWAAWHSWAELKERLYLPLFEDVVG